MKPHQKTHTAIIGFVTATIAAAPAASITVDTVGTINGNGRTILEATGNSLNAMTFGSDIATAFGNNTGGVWNFDGSGFAVSTGETITLKYGTMLSSSLVLTLTGNAIDQANVPTEATSGSFGLGLQTDGVIRTFSPDTPLLTVGVFNTDRNDSGRLPVLTVNYLLGGSASTSGADADNTYFHGLSGTMANPIVSFSLSSTTDTFVRYDDLGFVAVPEPSAAMMGLLAIAGMLSRRRR